MNGSLRLAGALSLSILVVVGGAREATATSPSSPSLKAFKAVAARDESGIVRIQTVTPAGKQTGTGIIIGKTLVVTVAHLVHGATSVMIEQGGSSLGTGTVIGADQASDLALVQSDTPFTGHEFKFATRPLKRGAAVAVLGGSPVTVSPGTVGALAGVLRVGGALRTGLARTDALVPPTASGGAIVTTSGALVGLADVGTKTSNGLAHVITGAVAVPLIGSWREAPQPIGGEMLNGCVVVPPPTPKPDGKLKETLAELSASKTYDAIVHTNCGTFTIQLDQAQSPNAVASFVELILKGFFDDTIFHRIVPGFIIQGGDPTGTGTGGPGYETVDTPPSNAAYTLGIVAMAKTSDEAPGTAGSQFFIVTAARASLTPDYAIIGKVTAGLNVIQRIGLLGQANQEPVQVVELESASVTVS